MQAYHLHHKPLKQPTAMKLLAEMSDKSYNKETHRESNKKKKVVNLKNWHFVLLTSKLTWFPGYIH